jgi:hypothetical protein
LAWLAPDDRRLALIAVHRRLGSDAAPRRTFLAADAVDDARAQRLAEAAIA